MNETLNHLNLIVRIDYFQRNKQLLALQLLELVKTQLPNLPYMLYHGGVRLLMIFLDVR